MTLNLENDLSLLDKPARDFLKKEHRLFIAGEWVHSASGETLSVHDPSSNQQVSVIQAGNEEDVNRAVAAAKKAFQGEWAATPAHERQRLIWKLSDLLEQNLNEFAQLECVDNGKSVGFATGIDIGGSVQVLRYFSGWATKIHGVTIPMDFPIPGQRAHAYTLREPVGVVGAIVPWNFPLPIAMWKVAPALAAGCTVVMKPAELTSMTALRFAELVEQAGFPKGVFNLITGLGEVVGAAMVSHPDIAKIAFTGSTRVGKLIQRQCADTLKHVTLELGGKSPMVVLEDADPRQVAGGLANLGIYFNSGQACTAGSRLLVHSKIYDDVVEEVGKIAEALVVGPGLSPDSQVWPIVSKAQQNNIMNYVQSGIQDGAKLVAGGKPIDATGNYVMPTLLADTTQDMKCVREEIFGPVLTASSFDSDEEAISIANDTEYGLAASVWGQNSGRLQNMVRRIEAGRIWVNTHNIMDPSLPFGGFKQSGLGVENGELVFNHYSKSKSVLEAY